MEQVLRIRLKTEVIETRRGHPYDMGFDLSTKKLATVLLKSNTTVFSAFDKGSVYLQRSPER